MRFARVTIGQPYHDATAQSADEQAFAQKAIAAYLYGNYSVVGHDSHYVYVEGEDRFGFTLEAIIDRLASGLYSAQEVDYIPSFN